MRTIENNKEFFEVLNTYYMQDYEGNLWQFIRKIADKIYNAYKSDGYWLEDYRVLETLGINNLEPTPEMSNELAVLMHLRNSQPYLRFWQFIVNVYGNPLFDKSFENVIIENETFLTTLEKAYTPSEDKAPRFNAEQIRDVLVEAIRHWFENNADSTSKAVIGISGGKDSTIVAALCARALGPDRVVGVMMPDGIQADADDSKKVVELLGIQPYLINIEPITSAANTLLTHAENIPTLEIAQAPKLTPTAQMKMNLPPRVRMTMLYAVSQCVNGRVMNTCNLSESWIGWETRWGDAVGDFSPLVKLTASEVIAIGDTMSEIPYNLIHKAPSDGLCGQTDEDKFGFTYTELDEVIRTGETENKEHQEKIEKMHKNSAFKRNPIALFDPNLNIANVRYLGENLI